MSRAGSENRPNPGSPGMRHLHYYVLRYYAERSNCQDGYSASVVYADIPLTPALRRGLAAAFGVPVNERAVRLHGGEESAAYRIGDVVVRIAPQWRTDREMEWFAELADHAAAVVPEVIAPQRSASGPFVVRLTGRPVSAWPFVAGEWPAKGDHVLRDHAAELLARLHKALAD